MRRSLLSLAVISLTFISAFAFAGKSPERTPDAGLASRVRGALHASFGAGAQDIGVTSQDGFVSLYGAVASEPVRERAARIAASVAGVRAVDNELGIEHHG